MTMQCVTIIGLGLIGGSLAKALRSLDPALTIYGIDPDAATRSLMMEEKTLTNAHSEITAESMAEANIVIIATPPHTWDRLAPVLAANLPSTATLVMDVGSVKSHALACFGQLPGFVPTHPIAGSQFSGAAFATEDLFHNKQVILTPDDTASMQSAAATSFWESLGCTIRTMDANTHDAIYACVSHLPQLMAYAIAITLPSNTELNETQAHFLRLAGSSPELWQGIFRYNPHLDMAAETFVRILGHMITELRSGVETTGMQDSSIAMTLLPRLIASCLIASVQHEEQKQRQPLASFAGSGFADMSAPAMTPPEDDLALISTHAASVVAQLVQVEQSLREMLGLMRQEAWDTLFDRLSDAQQRYLSVIS